MSILPNMSGQILSSPTVLQKLIAHLGRPVTARTRARATRHVLDWLACAAAGANTESGHKFSAMASLGAAGPCTMLSTPPRDWWHALQLNASVGNMLEMDDLHRSSIVHPAPVIVPAAIAVAELVGASSEVLLNAIVRGYEATIRIGRALGAAHYRFFHNTSTCGSFGAAAAAADLLKLSADQTAWALANAGSRTGGLWQMRFEDCETKSVHNAQAAQLGVQSALLALHGVRGPLSLLEGAQGLFAAMAPGANPQDVMSGFETAGEHWLIEEVSFKPWPACRHAHPSIDAALALRGRVAIEQISSVDVSTYKSALDFCDQPNPKTELQAKFSLQHCTATSLLHGAPWLPHFLVDALSESRLRALRDKVSVYESRELTSRFPQHYGARVSVKLRDGSLMTHEQLDALGDPEMPLTDAQMCDKARKLFANAGVDSSEALIDATLALASASAHEPIGQWTARWP
jgi:2-methylcitrate dehydratase PrpD